MIARHWETSFCLELSFDSLTVANLTWDLEGDTEGGMVDDSA